MTPNAVPTASAATRNSATSAGLRIGPIQLKPGVSRFNAITFFYACFFTICLLSFISFLQPYVLTENLGMAFEQQGKASGTLSFVGEIVVLLLVAPFGALADKIGRRPVYALGFAWVGAGFLIYPLATTFTELLLCRMFFAVGTAALGGMMAVVLADYPEEHTRGKMVAFAGICQGFGAVTSVFLLSKLPTLFASYGFNTLMAGRLSFWVATALAVIAALVVLRGLQAGVPAGARSADDPHKEKLVTLLLEGGKAARGNPRIMLACMESFCARGDLVVIGTFFSLWAKQAGLEQGLSLEEAIREAGKMAGLIAGATMVWAPVWAFVMDRFDRATVVAMAMAMACVGYMWVGFSEDPLSKSFIPAAIFLGFGEFCAIVSGQSIIGQEAPERIRGSVIGLFGLCGAIGLLFISLVGGIVFDAWMPGAPFVLVATVNGLIFFMAVYVRIKTGYKSPHEAQQ